VKHENHNDDKPQVIVVGFAGGILPMALDNCVGAVISAN